MSELMEGRESHSQSVLILEDESSVARLYSRLAKRFDLPTRTAGSLEELARTTPNSDMTLVLLDIALIGGDAFDALRIMREWRSEVRIVLISGQDANILRSTRLFAEELGLQVLHLIQKPVVAGPLMEILESFASTESWRSVDDVHSLTHSPYLPGAILDDEFEESANLQSNECIRALKNNEFVPWFQPIVDLTRGRVTGVEALVRWERPDGEVVGPGGFLGDIDRLGLMPELTFSVLDQSIKTCADWSTSGLSLSMSVNLQANLIARTDLAQRIQESLSRHGVRPSALTLEITERQELLDLDISLESLSRLRMQGVGLAIDDFGKGFSGFDGVRRLPLTRLKVDRDLMVAAVSDSNIRKVVKALSILAGETGIETVAEGIETETMARLSGNLGMHMGQGFLWSPAVKAGEMAGVVGRIESGFDGFPAADSSNEMAVLSTACAN